MHLIDYILPTFAGLGIFGYWVVFLFSFGESLAFVGNLLPGTIVVIFSGFLASQKVFDVGDLIWFVAIGAILGDVLSFYLGVKGVKFFKDENKFLKLSHLEKGKEFFKRHGNKSVFLGRFVAFVRPITPFIAGLSGMDKKSFLFWDILSGFAWALLNIFIGYFFGFAMPVVEKWMTRFGLFTAVLVLIGVVIFVFTKKSQQISTMSRSLFHLTEEIFLQSSFVKRIKAFYPAFFQFCRDRFNKNVFSGLPLSSIIFFSVIFVFMFDYFKAGGFGSDFVYYADFYVTNFILRFRSEFFVKFFTWVTTFGQAEFVLSLTAVVAVLLWLWGKRNYIIPLVYSVFFSECFVYLGKIMVMRLRPGGIIPVYFENDFSFPSGHAAISVAFYGFISYLFWKLSEKWKYKAHALFVGIVMVLGVGFSRIYLGVHFLSDVFGGYLIGGLTLLSAIFISEWVLRRMELTDKKFPVVKYAKVISIFLIAAEFVFYGYYVHNFNPPLNEKAIQAIPAEESE